MGSDPLRPPEQIPLRPHRKRQHRPQFIALNTETILKKLSTPLSILTGPLSRILFSLIFATCRFERFGTDTGAAHRRGQRTGNVLYVTWHQRLIPYIWYYRFKEVVVMASMSRDGELAARYVSAFGWIPVRGSSKKRGREALLEMVPFVKKGHPAALACDAPTGPAYISKIGITALAQKTGRPIQAGMWCCDRFWTLKSWDRTLIPKPFSRIVLMFSEPIHVAEDATRDEVEAARQLLDERLNTMMYQADRFFQSGVSDPREIPVPCPVPRPNPKETHRA